MSVKTVITDAGFDLLRAAPGHRMVYNRAACGAGSVDNTQLAELTDLVDYVMDLSIVEVKPTDTAATLRLQLDNSVAPREFQLYQIGIFAKLFNEDGSEYMGETLLQVMQYEQPDIVRAIPHLSEFVVNTLTGQAETVEGIIDLAAYVSIRHFREEVDSARKDASEELKDELAAHNEDEKAHGDLREQLETLEKEMPEEGLGETLDEIQEELEKKVEASDMSSAISSHNNNEEAHPGIQAAVNALKTDKANTADVPTIAAMNTAISTHNTATGAHSDIRTALAAKASQADLNNVKTTAENAASAAGTAQATANTASNALNGFTFYKSLSELGLTEGQESMESIAGAMANNSVFLYSKGTTNTSSAYPATTGVLLVVRSSQNRTVFQFDSHTSAGSAWQRRQTWTAFYEAAASPAFSGWQPANIRPTLISLPLASDVTNRGGSAYWRDSSWQMGVKLDIAKSSGYFTDGQVVATLPTGYGPAGTVTSAVVAVNNNNGVFSRSIGVAVITSSGEISVYFNATNINIIQGSIFGV